MNANATATATVGANALRDPRLWAWGVLAPIPSLFGAGAAGAFVGSAVDDARVGVAVFALLVLLVANRAYRFRPAYLAAFAVGCIAAFVAAFGLLLMALASAPFG